MNSLRRKLISLRRTNRIEYPPELANITIKVHLNGFIGNKEIRL